MNTLRLHSVSGLFATVTTISTGRQLTVLLSLLFAVACDNIRLHREVAEIHGDVRQQMAREIQRKEGQQSIVSVHSGNWVGNTVIAVKEPVPAVLSQTVTMVTVEPQSLDEIAARIVSKTAIPVRLEPELSAVQPSEVANISGVLAEQSVQEKIVYRHHGTIHAFLDDIASRLGIVWEYVDGQIRFSRFMTRIFVINMLPGTSNFAVTVGGQATVSDESLGSISTSNSTEDSTNAATSDSASGTVAESGSVKQSTDVNSKLDRWDELINAMRGLLSKHGRLNASPSTGSVVVTDSPGVLHRMKLFVDHQNIELTRQIALNVHVFSITEDKESESGVNWQLLFRDSTFAANLITPSLRENIGTLRLGIIDNNSRFKDSAAIIKALNTLNNVSTITSANLVTLNNQPAPVQVTRTIGYLRSISNVVTGTSGVSETTLQPGRITAGFIMTVTPRVLTDNRILIRFAADLSALLRFQQRQSDGASIQTPETDERAFLHEVVMRSGQSLLLSGFEQLLGDNSDSGVGSSRNWLAGSNRKRTGRTRILIVISPQLTGDRYGSDQDS